MPSYVPTATVQLLYNNRNVTRDISADLLSFSYVDKISGESDELSLSLQDKNNLWSNDWYPEKGTVLTAEISYKGATLPCGSFTLDEIELSGPPDTVNIRALASFITQKTRTRNNSAHENKTLSEIARTIAGRHGLIVIGTIPAIRINRVTQHGQTDLSFLYSLATAYGVVFSVRNNKMIFTSIYDLESKPGIVTLTRSDLSSYQIKDKTAGTYKSARLTYHNVAEGKLISHSEQTNQGGVKSDSLDLRVTAENEQQATLKTRAALHHANSMQKEGSISTDGNPLLLSGNNFSLIHMGVLSGIYNILESTHNIDRSGGYSTSVNIKCVGAVSSSLYKP